MAETELSVLTRQCLNRRIADAQMLASEVSAWQERRNCTRTAIRWQFTT
ncbi:MAG: hypothetical protein M3Y13_04320 [Armatimonadota bacterium]|nr:hypothetical protein [Armatimonadota bacterium]